MIYIGSLSKTLSHGLRIGFVVAPAPLIRELRALRRLMMRHPPTNNAHAAARFIAHGFHEAFVRRLNIALPRSRRQRCATRSRVHLPRRAFAEARGGSALWLALPVSRNTRTLAVKALNEGIVIEPGEVFMARRRRAISCAWAIRRSESSASTPAWPRFAALLQAN